MLRGVTSPKPVTTTLRIACFDGSVGRWRAVKDEEERLCHMRSHSGWCTSVLYVRLRPHLQNPNFYF
jgi:hypothetical protein